MPEVVLPLLALLVGVIVCGALVVTWALVMQRQALAGQKRALFRVEESLDLSRRNVDATERTLELAEQSVRNQQEIIRLLRQLVREADAAVEATGLTAAPPHTKPPPLPPG
jgi:hypothetical protein